MDGRPNQQACQITVHDGMIVQHQNAPDSAGKVSG
ncbi:MAG: 2Fe-2S iron-sulfur cluster-binding protein [Candidatus Puniceispirillaceae bacterium]